MLLSKCSVINMLIGFVDLNVDLNLKTGISGKYHGTNKLVPKSSMP